MAPGGQRLAGHHQLVAGGEQRHPQAAEHRQRGAAHRGGEAEHLRAEALAGGEHHRAAGDVLAGATDPFARAGKVVDEHAVAVEAAELLHHHRVGALGDRRAGEDAGGGARRQRMADAAGRDALGDHQPRASGGHVGTAQRIAVHRRVVEGRYVEAGDLVDREHPP